MRILVFSTLIVISTLFPGFSQPSLSVDLIADSLKEGSYAVTRYLTTTYHRESLESYHLDVHYAVTVLNARGKHTAKLVIPYDRNSEVSDIEGTVYDENGLVLGKLKKKDLKDYPSNASYTLFSDNRVKTISPSLQNYPYTVEYSYTVNFHATVGFGNWMPLKWYNTSTEHAELHVITPSDLGIRYKALNHSFDFRANTIGEVNKYSWTVQNLKAIQSEPNMPNSLEYMPVVMLSPDDISYEGTTGSYQTWNDYGKWVFSLIKDRDRLPEETVTRMKQLCDTIPDPRDKVKAVYTYMQNRTRYVNIALGIGGFQPLHAYEVDEKGYGDCKALSNYTRALLKCVGIASYYTEIGNGRSRELLYPDFASVNQTNHVILCVPLDQDTVWLECTSQSIPFAYIGAGNSDRYALLVGENGGVLARTPVYPSFDNLRESRSHLSIDESGSAEYEVTTKFINVEYDAISGLLNLSSKEQRESLLKYVVLEGFNLGDFTIKKDPFDNPGASISMRGSVYKFASKSGKRLFLRPEYLFSQTGFKALPDNREQNLYRAVGYHHLDTVSIDIPESYRIENMPESVSLESDFGSYSLGITQVEKGIQIIRDLEIFRGNYGKSQFNDYNSFTEAINRSDQSRIIIGGQ